MFNFSANHLLLLADGVPVYRLYDFTKSQQITPDHFYCVSGNVNSADKLYLVIESVKRDTKHHRDSTVLARTDGAGGQS